MSKFHTLRVVDVVRETADAISVAFQVPDNLKEEYKYKPGQYLTFKVQINGEELRRSYSTCSSPAVDADLRVAIKKVHDGRMSTFMNDNVKVGDEFEVMVPMGNFYADINPSNRKSYVLYAGGSGITPMFSILKTVLKEEPQSTVTLFYGNNDDVSIIFKSKLDTIVSENADRIKVYHVLNTAPLGHPSNLQGLMTKEKCIELTKNNVNASADNEYFICGPGPMMENVMAVLPELNVAEEKIHIEYFTTPVSTGDEKKEHVVAASTPDGNVATIIFEKESHKVVLEDNETILEAAIRIDLDPPFACQGGSCCTCRALLEEGEVDMEVNFGLSKSEVKKGYILTCQSRPTTSNVVVNYDKG